MNNIETAQFGNKTVTICTADGCELELHHRGAHYPTAPAATKVQWKIQRRGGYTNHIAEVYGIRLAVFRPTPEADYVLAIDHTDQPGTYATATAGRKAAEAIVAGWDAIAEGEAR